jgi:hypothetical protein
VAAFSNAKVGMRKSEFRIPNSTFKHCGIVAAGSDA